MSQCCDNETQCETECATECCKPQACDTSAGECPIERAAEMWKGSFFQAMREAQVEVLKAKILKAHGPMLDQAADAMLAAAMGCWQSQVAKVRAAEAAHGFKEKLRDLWLQENKK